jgi:uncharacterized protein
MRVGALYAGSVMHRRVCPRQHRFRYRAFWLLVDVNATKGLANKPLLLSFNRANLFSLNDRDHGDGSGTPLGAQIESLLGRAGLDIAGGRVRLLAMPRMLGFCFNPLSIYFCSRADGSPAAIVYEVHNTFGERHSYVIPLAGLARRYHQSCAKSFYVSPFLEMDMEYAFTVTEPGEHLAVSIRVAQRGANVLFARLAARRHALTDLALLKYFFLMPAMTLKAYLAIHWEAARLWLKGVQLRPRPLAQPVSSEGEAAAKSTV